MRLDLRGLRRRALLLAGAASALLLCAKGALAEDVAVPVSLQAELLVKVATYDKNLGNRAGDRVRLIILQKPENPDSVRIAAQMSKALSQITGIAGLPHEAWIASFTTAEDLAVTSRAKRVAILYVTPGFDADIGAIANALSGISVLTVSAVASYVPKRIVLGFDLISGKAKLCVNLTQARLQSVAFKPDLLKLTKIYE